MMVTISLYIISVLITLHLFVVIIYNYKINSYEASTFIKYFPYHFLSNLIFSKNKTDKPYFSLRVDINTSSENVKENNEGLKGLIKKADAYSIPITFSISSEYIPALSDNVKVLIKQPQHEVISHSHEHEDITKQNQQEQISRSIKELEKEFGKTIKGLIAPRAKHDKNTLRAVKNNDLKYISAGTISLIRYWSFPYPFKKDDIWLIGGGIPSDHYLYHQKNRSPGEAITIWKNALQFRKENNWFTQLEYHNFSTSKKELEVMEDLFKYIKNSDIEAITQSELLDKI